MDSLWNKEIHDIREAILSSPMIEQKFSILENYFSEKGKRKSEPNLLIKFAVDQLMQSPDVWTINKLTQKVGVTQKHLISLFKKYVGLTPKQLARICKFQKVIQLVEKKKQIEWTPIAYECGYYDQAHFINEFKAFSGLNPSSYLVQRGEYINYLPVKQG